MDDSAARKERVRAQFDHAAAGYDGGVGSFRYFGARLVEAAGVEPGHRVLDVATGRGAVLFPAAERAGSSGEVTGIDLSPEMVRLTGADLARRGLSGRVLVMDAERMDFADGSFDRVLCGFGVMFLPDQRRGLGEFRRVLRAGGRVAVSTPRLALADDLSKILYEMGLSTPVPGWITEPDALRGLLQDAGFADVHVAEHATSFVFPDVDVYWESIRGGLRQTLDGLDGAQRQRARSTLVERLRDRHGPDGISVPSSALIGVATKELAAHARTSTASR